MGLRELFGTHVDLGSRVGKANVGDKALPIIASLLAGGDSIDDTTIIRTIHSKEILGQKMPEPSTLGVFLRSFESSDICDVDMVSAKLLQKAWLSGISPDDEALTIDVDSTICRV